MKEKTFFKKPLFIFGSIVSIFVVFTSFLTYQFFPIDSTTVVQSGSFGDTFGILTAFFSALAFGALVITLWQQQEDLTLTRQSMKEQQFENILFKMIEIHATIVSDIDMQRTDENKTKYKITGRDCFKNFRNGLRSKYKNEKDIVKAYDIWWIEWSGSRVNLSHYFRYLYNIFKIIDKSNNAADDKRMYANIVRSQLSDYELVILFYNCISNNGGSFKKLSVKYSLFKNLPDDLLFDIKHKYLLDK